MSQLARLADGSLPEAHSGRLRDQAAASPALAAELAAQQRVAQLLRNVDEPAPASLQARVRQMVEDSPQQAQAAPAISKRARNRHLRRPLAGISLVAVCAAGAVAAVLTLGPNAPTLDQTVHIALASSTMPAPAPTTEGYLSLGPGISFPSWLRDSSWHATGARVDAVDGRRITTVFYVNEGSLRVGYAIVSGAPLSVPHEAIRIIDGTPFTVAHTGKITVITWVHAGHTCVIAGRDVSTRVALALATDA